MPKSALTRSLATLAVVVGLVGTTLAAPSATAADRGDRKAPANTSQRAVLASKALVRAQDALAGKGGDATMALRDLHMLKDALSPADRAAADKLATRPVKTNTLDSGNIRIHYTPAEFTLSEFTPTDVLNTAVSVSQLYSSAGYRQPKPDFGKGGSNQTDIYVDQLEPGLYGYCTIDNDTVQPGPGRYDVPAFCVVDADYIGFPQNTPLENLQVTVAHEYFHATQFAYDFYEDGWWMEATAAWVEDEAYTSVNDNVQYLADSPITDQKRSMDKFGGLYHYGVWIFFRYLTEKFPKKKGMLPEIILDFWKAADSSKGAKKDKYSTQAINAVLGRGKYKKLSFDKAFAYFSDANRRAKSFYSEGAANNYPEKKLAGSKKLKKGQGKKFTAKLDHLSSNTYRFTPKKGNNKLALAISGPPKAAGTRAVVTIWKSGGKAKQKFVKINGKGRGSMKVPFKAGDITAVEVTLVNASIRYTKCYPPASQYTAYACGGKPTDQKRAISVFGKVV